MSRQCQLTGKKTVSGQNRPFSMKATKRTFRPNLFTKKMFNPETGKVERMRLSAKAIKTLKKWAADNGKVKEYDTKKQVKGPASTAGEGKHVKKEKLTPKQKKEEMAKEELKVAEAAEMKEEKKED